MALTTLDKRTAVIVIDLQAGTVGLPTVHPSADIVDRAGQLATAFRRHALPVILVTVAGGAAGRNEQPKSTTTPAPNWTELAPGLHAADTDYLVTKKRWGAFHDTSLNDYLTAQRITQVVLLGIATSIGVESTARAAHEHGYNVTLATDAMTDLNSDAHTNSVERIFPKLGETGTTAEVLGLLERTR